MVGREYDAIRKLMIKSLPGESGWRFGKPQKAEETPLEQTEAEEAPVNEAGRPADLEVAVTEAAE